jgi:hypothetical protein
MLMHSHCCLGSPATQSPGIGAPRSRGCTSSPTRPWPASKHSTAFHSPHHCVVLRSREMHRSQSGLRLDLELDLGPWTLDLGPWTLALNLNLLRTPSSPATPPPIPMEDILSTQFDRVEKALSTLVDSIAAYNPSPQAAVDLVAADDQLSHGLDQRENPWQRRSRWQKLTPHSLSAPSKPRSNSSLAHRSRSSGGTAQDIRLRPGKLAP